MGPPEPPSNNHAPGHEAGEPTASAAGPIAVIRTAVPLSDAERKKILQRLRRRLGQRLQAQYEVDPALLGGVQARVGDELIDNSIVARLAQLREVLVKGDR